MQNHFLLENGSIFPPLRVRTHSVPTQSLLHHRVAFFFLDRKIRLAPGSLWPSFLKPFLTSQKPWWGWNGTTHRRAHIPVAVALYCNTFHEWPHLLKPLIKISKKRWGGNGIAHAHPYRPPQPTPVPTRVPFLHLLRSTATEKSEDDSNQQSMSLSPFALSRSWWSEPLHSSSLSLCHRRCVTYFVAFAPSSPHCLLCQRFQGQLHECLYFEPQFLF